ncbi:MAG: hypothetical protein ACOCZ5_00860 [bacterium]
MVDIRRALEQLVPDAKWDFSVPNEGGDEVLYNKIVWKDSRSKPSWDDIVSIAHTFDEADLETYRQGLSNTPLQFRRAIRELGYKEIFDNWKNQLDEDTKEDLEYCTNLKRKDVITLNFQAFSNLSDDQIDEIFELGLTLE